MFCFCLPKSEQLPSRHHHYYFHWPNFSFSHSEHTVNPRRIHSTFNLQRNSKLRHKRTLRRRHTLDNGTLTKDIKKPKRHRKYSSGTQKTAPPAFQHSDMGGEEYAPPPGPPPGYHHQEKQPGHVSWAQSGNRTSELNPKNAYQNAHISAPQGPPPSSSSDTLPAYEPPPGPPPSWAGDKKAAPSSIEAYAPPPGPPPSHQSKQQDDEPPPYDPWMAVPDSSFLPPPPSLRDMRSPGANATWDDAAKGHAWCRQTPLWPAQPQNSTTLERIQAGDIYLTAPPPSHANPRTFQLTRTAAGRTRLRTSPHCTDTIFLSDLPLYPALSPAKPRTIYYELRVQTMGSGREEAGIAIGFLAPPYPSWRLPGWHRASIGVHGDDGRRFVDDSYGGIDFTQPFRKGDVVGVGMTFSAPTYTGGKNRVECFFTRNGRREGGWDLHEEIDRQADVGDVEGLEGGRDVLAAVGVFGGVEVEVVMGGSGWRFRPEGV